MKKARISNQSKVRSYTLLFLFDFEGTIAKLNSEGTIAKLNSRRLKVKQEQFKYQG